jgi:hypothetical protein
MAADDVFPDVGAFALLLRDLNVQRKGRGNFNSWNRCMRALQRRPANPGVASLRLLKSSAPVGFETVTA